MMNLPMSYLEQQAVDHHEIANCEAPFPDAVRGEQHRAAERRREDHVLPKVEGAEAVLRFQRSVLISCQSIAE